MHVELCWQVQRPLKSIQLDLKFVEFVLFFLASSSAITCCHFPWLPRTHLVPMPIGILHSKYNTKWQKPHHDTWTFDVSYLWVCDNHVGSLFLNIIRSLSLPSFPYNLISQQTYWYDVNEPQTNQTNKLKRTVHCKC